MNTQQTVEKMKSLRLQGMQEAYQSSLQTQTHLQLSSDELLSMLIDAEWQDRANKRVARLTQGAAFRYTSHLSEINYQAARDLDRELLSRLATCQFIQQKENVLLTGPTGVGKSFIASAIGHQACAMGYKTAYYNTAKLFTKLHGAKADNSLYKEIARIEKTDLLILDDFGLQNLDKPQRDLLMEIIEDRHNRKSTLIASQLPVSAWYEVIGEGTIADAILDRLVHAAHRMSLSGESLRKVKNKPIIAGPVSPIRVAHHQPIRLAQNHRYIHMRDALGDGYAEALRKAYKGAVPDSADFVMYWWYKAAEILAKEGTERFGFITTNSITQSFNRRVLQAFMEAQEPISITYAIPDHPWVDSGDGAQVRIAMTVAEKGKKTGRLNLSLQEKETGELGREVILGERIGTIHSDIKVGANVAEVKILKATENMSSRGVIPHGAGLIITPDEASKLGLGSIAGIEKHIRNYWNGKDFTTRPRGLMVIDLLGLTIYEVRSLYSALYQHILLNVKPHRDENKRAAIRDKWWIFAEPRKTIRKALNGLERYIATPQTAKHRIFQFLNMDVLPDDKLIAIAFEDAFFLGVLQSKIHVIYSLATGSRLGVGNDSVYDKSRCFDTFPFPAATQAQKEQIRRIAEQLDAHRKQRQAQHPTLTITDMYNVLEKLRSGESLTPKEQKTHEQGLVSILLQLHQELDAAVAAAYGWPASLPEEEILERLVALNKERAAEEARGLIRWLRPEYQNPQGTQQGDLGIKSKIVGTGRDLSAKEVLAWPKTLSEQAQVVQRALQLHERPATAEDLLRQFKPVAKPQQPQRLQQIDSLLQTLHGLGLVRKTEQEQYVK